MSFERSYRIESNEIIKEMLFLGDKGLILPWWVTYIIPACWYNVFNQSENWRLWKEHKNVLHEKSFNPLDHFLAIIWQAKLCVLCCFLCEWSTSK